MPPRTGRRHKQGAESRERILEVALELAAERGYDGTTMALVTERSGLPASSVYWHFKNKDALLAEVLEYSYSSWRAGEDAAQAADSGDTRARFRGRFDRVQVGLAERPEFWRIGLTLALLSGPDTIAARDRFLQVRRETLASTVTWCNTLLGADAVASHPDLPVLLTQVLMAASDGLFMASQTDRAWDFRSLTDELGRAFGEVTVQRAAAPRTRRRPHAPVRPREAPRPAPEESRDRLLWAAARVAAERGYVGTTISRVCAESGLPVSSVYWYFEDKDALLAAVVERSWEEWLRRIPAWAPAVGADERDATLRKVLRRSVRSFVDAPDFLRVGHGVALARQEEETAARALFLRVRREAEQQLTAWFADSLVGSPAEGDRALPLTLARLVIATTDGLFLAEQVDDWDWDFDAVVDLLVDVLEAVVAGHEHARSRRTPRTRGEVVPLGETPR